MTDQSNSRNIASDIDLPRLAAMEEGIKVGVIENLINPEFGDSWVRDLLAEENLEDLADEEVDRVDDMIRDRLREMSKEIIGTLHRSANIETYSKFL